MAQKDVGNKVPIYKLKKTDEVMKYYDEWDQKSFDPNYKSLRLKDFEPYVRKVFSRTPYKK